MLEILVLFTVVVTSLLAGFWIRGRYFSRPQVRTRAVSPPRTDHILARVGELSRDVDHHKLLVQRISAELHALAEGDSAATVKAINKLIESNERMQSQLELAEQQLQSQAREIADHSIAAQTDALTKLSNRRRFDEEMTEASHDFVQEHQPTTVAMMDIDHFKHVNDTYGHQAGDEVLRTVAHVIRDAIPSQFLVCRFGGEEFSIIFRRTNLEDTIEIVEAVRQAIQAARIEFAGMTLHVTVSLGLAQFLFGESTSSLLGRTDTALYASKGAGRNCGHLHDGTSVLPLRDWAIGAGRLLEAAEEAWQPEVGISTPAAFCHDVRRRISDFRDGVAPLSMLFVQVDDIPAEICRDVEKVRQAAIRAVILTIKATMREMDHAARFERDALSVMLPGCTLAGAATVAERLREAVERRELPARFDRRHFTISIGIAEAQESEDEDQLIYRVRQSIAAARAQGQNCIYIHDGVHCRPIRVTPAATTIG
jgi:diguanylate cyclase (GGDEF)-like protein